MTEYQVSANTDDGRQLTATMETGGTIIRVASGSHWAAMRFLNIASDPNLKVLNAVVKFYAKTYLSPDFDIYGELNDSPATLSSTNNDISDRTRTTAVVAQSGSWTDETWEDSPNIASILNEIFALPAWNSGDDVMIILDANSGGDAGWRGHEHDPTLAAKLDVTLTTVNLAFTMGPLTGLYATQTADLTNSNTSTTNDTFTGGSWLWEYRIDTGPWQNFPANHTAFNPSLTGLTTLGSYSIRLTGTTANGSTATFTRTNYFTVEAARTVTAAASSSRTSGPPGVSIDFFSTGTTTTDPGGIVSYVWERKLSTDTIWATFAFVANPTGIVGWTQGNWDIRLTPTSDLGATDTITLSSHISITPSKISLFRAYGAPGGPVNIPAKMPLRPSIPTPAAAGVIVNALVFDFTGKAIGEFRPEVDTMAWSVNRVTKVQLPIAQSHPKFRPDFFEFGRIIYLELDNGLPPWVGVVDDPEEWDYDRLLVTLSSAEVLLYDRRSPRTLDFRQAKVGGIFRTVIETAIAEDPVGFVTVGEVWGGGLEHSPTYHYKNVGDIIEKSLVGNLSAGAFDVTPHITTGTGTRIELRANLYGRKGQDRTNIALVEPQNITNWRIRRTGKVINDWLMVADNVDKWDDTRLTAVSTDTTSISKYRRRQGFEVRSGVTNIDTLKETAANRLDLTKVPYFDPVLEVIDRRPATFSQYGIGDVIPVEVLPPFFYVGAKFNGEIMAREFDVPFNVCDLILRSVPDG